MENTHALADARATIVGALVRDAVLHEQGEFEALGSMFEELDAQVPRGAGPAYEALLIALRFMDDWLDARNHEWQYHAPLRREDWPVLARSLAEDLSADRGFTNTMFRRHFLNES